MGIREAWHKWDTSGSLNRLLSGRLGYTRTRRFEWNLRSSAGSCNWQQLRKGKHTNALAFTTIYFEEQLVTIGAFLQIRYELAGVCAVPLYTLFTEIWPAIPHHNDRLAWELVDRETFTTTQELRHILQQR